MSESISNFLFLFFFGLIFVPISGVAAILSLTAYRPANSFQNVVSLIFPSWTTPDFTLSILIPRSKEDQVMHQISVDLPLLELIYFSRSLVRHRCNKKLQIMLICLCILKILPAFSFIKIRMCSLKIILALLYKSFI